MNYKLLLPFLAVAFTAQAQDTYTDERITNNSGDVIGTARYVGMGGALGALGADISVISWNPAGIGLYRKNDIALTFGGTWGKSYIAEENRGRATFDQIGFVYNMPIEGEACRYVNFSFNFQKKINFNQNFYANNPNLYGLSQMDQLAELIDWDRGGYQSLAGMAYDGGFFKEGKDSYGEIYQINKYGLSSSNTYTHHSEGSLQAFDFNLSTNISDRAFLGLTVGVDNMRYSGWNYYSENDKDWNEKYGVNNDIRISGTGVNVKVGTIIRPFENSPFRVGLVVETPTWYRLRNTTKFELVRSYYYGGIGIGQRESYLKFNLRSPWKVRTSIGSTIGTTLAWDVDYEFAAYAGTSMGYPEYENDWDGSTSGNIKDVSMNKHISNNLRGTHTLRVGLEANATKNLAFRLGYNLSTSAYEKNINYDQYVLGSENSPFTYYSTNTSYMRLGATNIVTLGMGYRSKNFYVDLAYKIRNQNGDFYAFDTNFAQTANGTEYANDNPGLADRTIDPVDVNLTRHAVTCTLGFKF